MPPRLERKQTPEYIGGQGVGSELMMAQRGERFETGVEVTNDVVENALECCYGQLFARSATSRTRTRIWGRWAGSFAAGDRLHAAATAGAEATGDVGGGASHVFSGGD